jgi:hypothetical protein
MAGVWGFPSTRSPVPDVRRTSCSTTSVATAACARCS